MQFESGPFVVMRRRPRHNFRQPTPATAGQHHPVAVRLTGYTTSWGPLCCHLPVDKIRRTIVLVPEHLASN
jgi:hypothetical protein